MVSDDGVRLRIQLSHVEVWNVVDQFKVSASSRQLLTTFLQYRQHALTRTHFHYAHLLTSALLLTFHYFKKTAASLVNAACGCPVIPTKSYCSESSFCNSCRVFILVSNGTKNIKIDQHYLSLSIYFGLDFMLGLGLVMVKLCNVIASHCGEVISEINGELNLVK